MMRTAPFARTRAGMGWLAAVLLVAAGTVGGAVAQSSAQIGTPPTAGSTTNPAPKQRQAPVGAAQSPTAAKPSPKAEGSETTRADGSPQLRQRLEQLEEQVNEMHVAVGTLESLAKSGAARAPSGPTGGGAGGLSGDSAARLDGLESRIRGLTSQIEQLAQQVRALEGRGGRSPSDRSDVAPPPASAPSRFADARPSLESRDPPRGGEPRQSEPAASTERGGGDAIGGLIRGPGNDRSADVGSAPLPPIGGSIAAGQPRQQPASLTTGGSNPREAYERAYGSLLKQDYAAAETGFAEFLQQHPDHELAGNAQYWLGESLYVRGQYRPAANAFLKGYQGHPKSQKGPDSLLKLGMSLDKLGQRDAACSSFGELSTRFPSAPAHVQSRAKSERARLGC